MTGFVGQIKLHFDSLSSREQWLIALTGFILLIGLAVNVVVFPQLEKHQQLQNQIVANYQLLEDVNILNAEKQQKLNVSANKEIEEQIVDLTVEIELADLELGNKVAGLVSASEMPVLMETVLKKSGNLKLLSMVSQPPVEFASTEDKRYYIHPIELVLKGTYFNIVNYLASLEALPIKYYWSSVDYQVLSYPSAQVQINVYTLSESPVFIGGDRVSQG